MKRSILIFFAFFISTLSLAAGEKTLFASLAMTKAQVSSPVPTDSGIFLYRPSDQRWHRLGPVIQQVSSMSTDPSNPEIIFLACGNGILRSQNNGNTWREVTGWRESDITKIAIDPTNGQKIYASSAWGVTISRDGGESWSAANEGLVEKSSRSIVVDHLNPERLLLATAAGLFTSHDSAETWTQIPSTPNIAILRLARNNTNPDLWIAGTEGAGVILSSDNGETWQPTAPELSKANIYGVATDPSNSKILAAGGWDAGLWLSTDEGKNWVNRGEGLPSQNVTATVFDQDGSGRLWVSTFEEGTYHSDDLGITWIADEVVAQGARGSIYGAYVYDLDFITLKE
jgi:ligand-binding sensor domain-containing protein